jgi:TPR repeat protein
VYSDNDDLSSLDAPTYRELVVFEEYACIPRFIVTLTSDEIGLNPQLKYALEPFELYIEAQKIKMNNPADYKKLLIQASEQGLELALYELGWCYRNSAREYSKKDNLIMSPPEEESKQVLDLQKLAYECFRKAAERGLLAAKIEIGFCYKRGDGVEKDLTKAIEIFKSTKDPVAYYELGFHYFFGDGVNKNLNIAFKYWKKAASRSMTKAEYRLGLCYLNAWGTDKNLKLAKIYFQRAADKGFTDAKYNIRNIETILKQTNQSNTSAHHQSQKSCSIM